MSFVNWFRARADTFHGALSTFHQRIALSGVAHRSGHALNNALLRAVFADRTAWRSVSASMFAAAAAA